MDLRTLQKQVWETVEENGFHEIDENLRLQTDSELMSMVLKMRTNERLMLIVTEVAEACESVRHNDHSNFAEELADIVIRVMDTAEQYGIDLEKEIIEKDKKNSKREFMHGGKAC